MNAKERTKLLLIFNNFEDLFDGTPGYWNKEPAKLDLKPYYKPFTCKYYKVSKIKKET